MEDPWPNPNPLLSIVIVLALIAASGFFSFFAFALASCRRPFLLKKTGGTSGKFYLPVLKTLENPRVYNLTCRFWINLFRSLAAFTAGGYVMRVCLNMQTGNFLLFLIFALSAAALILVTILLGDMLPKISAQIAPEKITAFFLPVIKLFSLPIRPFDALAARFDVRLRSVFHLEAEKRNMTEDELRIALMEGEKSGIVESNERIMVEGVFYLGDRPVGTFMTHRSEIEFLDINNSPEEIRSKAIKFRNQGCFPVTNGNQDEIIGVVYPEDIILNLTEKNPRGLAAIMKKAQFVPETMTALKAFESFKNGQANFLFVIDEYGGLAGIISAMDLVEEIVGEMAVTKEEEKPLVRQEDGSWLADGTLNIDEAAEALGLPNLVEEHSSYHTLAGFILSLAGELPGAGDSFLYQGYRFTVKSMDGNRIDKLAIIDENVKAK
jgi:putative hemolysin